MFIIKKTKEIKQITNIIIITKNKKVPGGGNMEIIKQHKKQ